MALSAPERELPDPSGPRTAARTARTSPAPRLRRPRVLVAVAIMVLIGAGLGVFASLAAESEPIAALGAAAPVPGGLARVNGVIPLERDGWLPDDAPAVLTEPVADGAHRVRILLELTALDAQGVDFSAADYTILGLGSGSPGVLWASPEESEARQGEVISATLVFEIPNLAVDLTLRGEDGSRLALGVGHHTPGR